MRLVYIFFIFVCLYKYIYTQTDPVFYGAAQTEANLKKMQNALIVFERYLAAGSTKYVVGDVLTIADFALISATICLEATDNSVADYPLITQWYDGFKKANPELWEIASVDMVAIAEYYKKAKQTAE